MYIFVNSYLYESKFYSLVHSTLSNHLVSYWFGFFGTRRESMKFVEPVEIHDKPLFAGGTRVAARQDMSPSAHIGR